MLEENGIATAVIGSALDIVKHCGTPRFLFNDLPLGNPLGIPYDSEMQYQSVRMGLDLISTATGPGTVVQTPFRWENDDWRAVYGRVDDSNREELRRMGEENRRRRAENHSKGLYR
ncbi:MAG: hypothetical protein HUJ31_12455 [Pseudomonadales bacterium]|nr:hypothetical protein [Pseudomonadales bacterium]